MNYLIEHYATIFATASAIIVAAMPLIELIVQLTPTKKDDKFLAVTKKVLQALGVPSRKRGGGKHEVNK